MSIFFVLLTPVQVFVAASRVLCAIIRIKQKNLIINNLEFSLHIDNHANVMRSSNHSVITALFPKARLSYHQARCTNLPFKYGPFAITELGYNNPKIYHSNQDG
jgi:hypothetical protein